MMTAMTAEAMSFLLPQVLRDKPIPEKIVVAGDWHGNNLWAYETIRKASDALKDEPYPLILHLGDFGIWSGPSAEKYRKGVSYMLTKKGAVLFFIDGNHENFNYLEKRARKYTVPDLGSNIWDGSVQIRENLFHLPRGKRWEWHNRKWLACGGAVSVDKQWRVLNKSWWTQETITPEQAEFIKAGGKCDVMITHDCPSMVFLDLPVGMFPHKETVEADAHRNLLQGIVNEVQPEYLMHGHMHRQYTKVLDTNWAKVRVDGLDMDGKLGNWFVLNTKTMEWVV
jgi:predicted phosphodiesterase